MLRVNPPPFKLSEYTRQDSDGNNIVKDHAYFAQSAGFVTAFCTMTSGADALYGHVGLTSDPVTEGNRIAKQCIGDTSYTVYISFMVSKGEYFEITSDSGTPEIWWKSVGTLKKPIDFD